MPEGLELVEGGWAVLEMSILRVTVGLWRRLVCRFGRNIMLNANKPIAQTLVDFFLASCIPFSPSIIRSITSGFLYFGCWWGAWYC